MAVTVSERTAGFSLMLSGRTPSTPEGTGVLKIGSGSGVTETGATPVTIHEAARNGEIVIVTIPEKNIAKLPRDLFNGVSDDVIVIDTGNYYPQQRDGRIANGGA